MTRKTILSVAVALFLMQAGHVNAKEGLFGAGARFEWDNYKKPVVVQRDPTSDTGGNIGQNVDFDTFGGPSIGGEFHVIPIDRLVISLGLDLGFFSSKVLPYRTNDDYEVKATYLTVGFLLGVKFYIIEPAPQKATLYAHLAGGKYITKLANNDPLENATDEEYLSRDAELEALGKLSAPAVVQLAIGAEYFVSSAFSIGADILGFRFSFSKYDNTGMGALPSSAYSGTQSVMGIAVYSGLTMNFGFAGKSGGKDDDEAGWGDEDKASGDGWGDGNGAAAGGGAAAGADASGGAANDGWGGAAGGDAAAGGEAGWGQPAGGGDAAGDGDGWGSTPTPEPTGDNGGGGWGAAPPPPPPSGGGGGGGGGGGKVKAKKAGKAKPKSAAPPPPPPGY